MKKLTWEAVREIRTQEHRQRYYAEKYGVSVSTISSVQTERIWRDDPEAPAREWWDYDDDEAED